MTTQEAIKNKDCTLIDIREPYELELNGKIDEAISIPMGEIPSRIDEIKTMKTPIVVFCGSGNRASAVIDFLSEKGIECINAGGFDDICRVLNQQ